MVQGRRSHHAHAFRDEGFHLLLIGAWDNDLGLDILRSWIDLIDEDGWVAREQILGEEARSKVGNACRICEAGELIVIAIRRFRSSSGLSTPTTATRRRS